MPKELQERGMKAAAIIYEDELLSFRLELSKYVLDGPDNEEVPDGSEDNDLPEGPDDENILKKTKAAKYTKVWKKRAKKFEYRAVLGIKKYDAVMEGSYRRVSDEKTDVKKVEVTVTNAVRKPQETAYKPDIAHDFYNGSRLENVEYRDPVYFNSQWNFQRVTIENKSGLTTVYDLTQKGTDSIGMEMRTRHDSDFNSLFIESMDGKIDGEGKRYWEFWINGQIGTESIEKQVVKPGDKIEWRLVTERDSGCGGSYREDVENAHLYGSLENAHNHNARTRSYIIPAAARPLPARGYLSI